MRTFTTFQPSNPTSDVFIEISPNINQQVAVKTIANETEAGASARAQVHFLSVSKLCLYFALSLSRENYHSFVDFVRRSLQ